MYEHKNEFSKLNLNIRISLLGVHKHELHENISLLYFTIMYFTILANHQFDSQAKVHVVGKFSNWNKT